MAIGENDDNPGIPGELGAIFRAKFSQVPNESGNLRAWHTVNDCSWNQKPLCLPGLSLSCSLAHHFCSLPFRAEIPCYKRPTMVFLTFFLVKIPSGFQTGFLLEYFPTMPGSCNTMTPRWSAAGGLAPSKQIQSLVATPVKSVKVGWSVAIATGFNDGRWLFIEWMIDSYDSYDSCCIWLDCNINSFYHDSQMIQWSPIIIGILSNW